MLHRPRIIAVAGGKGGVGKSTVAANLSLALAKAGNRVIVVDADLGSPNLHTMLGLTNPPRTLAELIDERVDGLADVAFPTLVPTCLLVPGVARTGSANLDGEVLERVLGAIRTADADCVVIDVGAGASYQVLDLVRAADVKLVVVTPQLTSLHNAYAMLKACVHRVVRTLATDETGQGLVDAALGTENKARTIAQLLDVMRPIDADAAERASDALRRFGLYLIGNQIGEPTEASVLDRIGAMIRDHLSVQAPVIATIPTSRSLAGGLRTRTAIDDTLPPFRTLARAVLDIDLDRLRGVSRSPVAKRQWGVGSASRSPMLARRSP